MAVRDRNILTKKQQETLAALDRLSSASGKSPTLQELATALGGITVSTVADRVRGLQKKGFITRDPHVWRGLKTVYSAPSLQRSYIQVPLISYVGADTMDVIAEQEFNQFMRVDEKLLRGHRDVFAMKVRGNSMRDANIHDGDYILAEDATLEDVKSGDNVIAIIEDKIILKRIEKGEGAIILHPENKSPIYQPIVITDGREDFRIVGRFIDAIRFSGSEDLEFIPE